MGLVMFLFGMGTVAWRFFLARICFRKGMIRTEVRFQYLYPMMIFVSLSVSNVVNSLGYFRYLNVFANEVTLRSGFIPLESTKLTDDRRDWRYGCPWTHPTLSLVLRKDSQQAIVLNPKEYKGWQPFDPVVWLPDLRRYYHDGRESK